MSYFCDQGVALLDDAQLLSQKQNVDYKSLKGQPSPEEFFLLSRIKGSISVAQICAMSGMGKDKTISALERLIDFGLLVAEGGSPRPAPVASPTPARAPAPVAASASDEDLFGGGPPNVAPATQPAVQPAQKPAAVKEHHQSFLAVIDQRDEDLFEAASVVRGGQAGLVSDGSTARPSPAPAAPQPVAAPVPTPAAPQRPAMQPAPSAAPRSVPLMQAPAMEIERNSYAPVPDEHPDDDDLFGGANDETSRLAVAAPKVSLFDDEPKSSPNLDLHEDIFSIARFPTDYAAFVPDAGLMAAPLELDAERRREILFVTANMNQMTYYDLFGVQPGGDRRELKRAYVVLSKRYHPDLFFRKNVGDFGPMAESIFKWVTKAFQVLQNPQKRAEYDQSLAAAQSAAEHEEMIDDHKRETAYLMLLQRAQRLEESGNYSDAVDEYRRALALQRDINVILRCAILLLRAGIRLDEAAMYARAVLGYEANHVEGLVVLGNIYERNGMLDDAFDAYDRAANVTNGDPSVQVHVERVRAALGR